MTKSNELKSAPNTVASPFPLLGSDKGSKIMSTLKDMGVERFDLDRIKAPAGGGLAFEVDGIDGVEYRKELTVVIGLMVGHQRTYYAQAYEDSEGGKPECSSTDGEKGWGTRGGDVEAYHACASCEFNEFGSARSGAGKACGEKALLYAFTEDSLIPVVVQVSATSLKPLKRFALKLMGFGLELHDVVTKIGLEKKSGRVDYSLMSFTRDSVLAPEHKATMALVAEDLGRAFAGAPAE